MSNEHVIRVIAISLAIVQLRPVSADEIPDADNTFTYSTAGVATDTEPCSTVGSHILHYRNGTAVDVAIAALLCIGVVRPHSSGIGGGAFFLIYSNKSAEVIDAREVAPEASTPTMYVENPDSSLVGGLAVAVPGELKGMEAAHKKFGRLPWKDLFLPAIQYARNGVRISRDMAHTISIRRQEILSDPGMKTFLSRKGGRLLVQDDIVRNRPLATTLEIIASQGVEPFYCGAIAENLIVDINERGGNMIKRDLCQYQVKNEEPLVSQYHGHVVLGVPPPADGAVLAQMLNIIDGFSNKTEERFSLGYHELVEAAKFAYSQRLRLGDPDHYKRVHKVTKAMMNR